VKSPAYGGAFFVPQVASVRGGAGRENTRENTSAPSVPSDLSRGGQTSRSTRSAAPRRKLSSLLDVAGVVDVLRETDFDGWVTVETDGWPSEPDEGAPTSMARLREVLA
jgi:hypothetical protein